MRTIGCSADSARYVGNKSIAVFENWPEPKVCFGIIKHLLNSTLSNIRLVLMGLVMSGAAVDVGLSLIQQAFNIVNIQ